MKNNKSRIFSKKINEDITEEEGDAGESNLSLIKINDDIRILGLYGEVEEVKVSQIIGSMIDMADTSEISVP